MNWRRRARPALRVAGALAGLVAALALAGCGSAESRRDVALERGAEHLAAGNLAKARVEFQNALQAAPDDATVRFRNAEVLERLGEVRSAIQFYEGAIEADPTLHEASRRLARLYLFAGLVDTAARVVEEGLKRVPQDPGLLAVRAAIRAVRGDPERATTDAETAFGLAPDDPHVLAVLAGLRASAGRTYEARALLERGIASNPRDTELRLALAQLLAAAGALPAAEAQLREIVRLQPRERAHHVRLARLLAGAGRDDDAEQVLRSAVDALPADGELIDALVSFLEARRGLDAARRELEARVAAAPQDARGRFVLAAHLQRAGDVAGAARVLGEVIDASGTEPDGLAARTRLAALRVVEGDRAGAEQLVAAVLAASPRDPDALILRGTLLLQGGDARGAIADLRAVLRDRPGATGVLRVLAQAHVVNREPALAEEALRRALESDPDDAGAALELGRLLLQLGRPESARPLLQKAVRARPADLEAQDALFRASLGVGDHAEARRVVEAIAAADESGARTPLYRGLLAEAQRHPEEALVEYQRAVAAAPRSPEALQGLIRALLALDRRPEALRRLDALASRESDYALPLAIRGDLLLAADRPADAEAAFAGAVERAPHWWLAIRGVAYARAAAGDFDGALALLADALPKVDEPLALRGELAQLSEAAGRTEDAIRHYEEILRLSPEARVAANNLAMLLVNHRGDPASIRRAVQLVEPLAGAEVPALLDTFGWVKLKAGDTATALNVLERVVAADPRTPVFRYHLAMAQAAAGQREEARTNLERVLAAEAPYPSREAAQRALQGLGPPLPGLEPPLPAPGPRS